jgi:hypothetical protein
MSQLKVRKKDLIILNAMLFLALSFLFLCLQHAYRHHLSPFTFTFLRKSAELFWPVAVVHVGGALLIWKHHRFARHAFVFGLMVVGYKVVEGLFIEFNKIIVVALFFYTVISYFLYQLLAYYLSLASVNANFSATDLFGPMLKIIPAKILVDGAEYSGHLTNWDDEGCFVRLDVACAGHGKAECVFTFKGREFHHSGEVVAQTLDFFGIGIKFKQIEKELNVFNWSEFMELADELGFQSQRLR